MTLLHNLNIILKGDKGSGNFGHCRRADKVLAINALKSVINKLRNLS